MTSRASGCGEKLMHGHLFEDQAVTANSLYVQENRSLFCFSTPTCLSPRFPRARDQGPRSALRSACIGSGLARSRRPRRSDAGRPVARKLHADFAGDPVLRGQQVRLGFTGEVELELAAREGLPVVLHERDDQGQLLLRDEHAARARGQRRGGRFCACAARSIRRDFWAPARL